MEHLRSSCRVSQRNTEGFTLIELMVVVSIVAILAALATPSFRHLIIGSQIRTAINDWTLAMQTARSEAVRQRAQVSICPSADGATCATSSAASFEQGWIVTIENSASSNAMAKLLQDYPPLKGVTMTANTTGSAKVTYLPNGLPIGNFSGMTITVMEDSPSPDASLTRYICVARSGRSRVFTNDQYLALSGGGC